MTDGRHVLRAPTASAATAKNHLRAMQKKSAIESAARASAHQYDTWVLPLVPGVVCHKQKHNSIPSAQKGRLACTLSQSHRGLFLLSHLQFLNFTTFCFQGKKVFLCSTQTLLSKNVRRVIGPEIWTLSTRVLKSSMVNHRDFHTLIS
jgi:hypothetical protein